MSLKKIQPLPDIETLQKLIRYEDGKLVWNEVSVEDQIELGVAKRERSALTRNTKYANKEAGHLFKTSSGTEAIQVRILGKSYYAHRVVYKLLKNEEPELIDHINGNPTDNRIENLRSVDNQTNSRNCKLFNTNTSGHVGVSWNRSNNKWVSYIWKDGRKIILGYYTNIDEAIRARKEAQQDMGFHQNHGRL